MKQKPDTSPVNDPRQFLIAAKNSETRWQSQAVFTNACTHTRLYAMSMNAQVHRAFIRAVFPSPVKLWRQKKGWSFLSSYPEVPCYWNLLKLDIVFSLLWCFLFVAFFNYILLWAAQQKLLVCVDVNILVESDAFSSFFQQFSVFLTGGKMKKMGKTVKKTGEGKKGQYCFFKSSQPTRNKHRVSK